MLARSSYYERPSSRTKADEPVIEVLNQVVTTNGRWVLGSVLIGCAIRAMDGMTGGYGEFTGRLA